MLTLKPTDLGVRQVADDYEVFDSYGFAAQRRIEQLPDRCTVARNLTRPSRDFTMRVTLERILWLAVCRCAQDSGISRLDTTQLL
jgi:hypothetical protein